MTTMAFVKVCRPDTPYVEPPYTEPAAFVVLLFFIRLNHGYFMGLLFLIAGYFTPGSFDRKGPRPFLRDRVIRLFVPLAAFVLLLNPISMIGVYQVPAKLTGIIAPFGWSSVPGLFGVGPLWFVEVLLILSFAYAGWRVLGGPRGRAADAVAATSSSAAPAPRHRAIGVFTFFRRFLNGESRLGRFLSGQSYAVYVIHTPLIVLLALALRGLHPEQLLKFGLAAAIAVPLCFGVAWLLRAPAVVSRVL